MTGDHSAKVIGYLDIAAEEGTEIVVDGREEGGKPDDDQGFFVGGSLLDHVGADMRVNRAGTWAVALRTATSRWTPVRAHAAWGRRARRLEPDPQAAPIVEWTFRPAAGWAQHGSHH